MASVDPGGTPAQDWITVHDAYGRELRIPKAEYADHVLPDMLRQKWDDPDGLYQTVVMSLRDGFSSQLTSAADRLVDLEPRSERAAIIKGIVQLENGLLDEAENTLRAHLDHVGKSGYVMTNLAKVIAARGNELETDRVLWEALVLDPNQDNALQWWALREKDREGEDGYRRALDKAIAELHSWRAELLLAREDLRSGDLVGAVGSFRSVLANAGNESDVLLTVSGDLGNAGQIETALDLVLPRYDPSHHDIAVGFNLIEACIQTHRIREGRDLIHRLSALPVPTYYERLRAYGDRLDAIDPEAQPRTVAKEDLPPIVVLQGKEPIWYRALLEPSWLLPERTRRTRVGVLTLADSAAGRSEGTDVVAQRVTPSGRWTRGIPLALGEALYFETDLDCSVLLPVVKGGGPVAVGQAWQLETLRSLTRGEEPVEFVVTGSIDSTEATLTLELLIWQLDTGEIVFRTSGSSAHDQFGPELLRAFDDIEGALIGLTGAQRMAPAGFYRRPHPKVALGYSALEDALLAWRLVVGGLAEAQSLWGQRDSLAHLLGLAVELKEDSIPKLMFLAGLASDRACASMIYMEFRERALQLLKDAEGDPKSVFGQVSPLLFRVFGEDAAVRARIDQLSVDASQGYRAWLDRV